MTVTARLNLVICLTVAIGILAFTIADEAWGLLLLGVAGSFIGYLAGRPDQARAAAATAKPWTLPRTGVNLLVFLAIANAALQASVFRDGQRPLVSTLGAFLIHVQLIKLVDRRSARDESQLLGLSLFGVIAAILTSNSLALGIALTIYTPLIVTAAMMTEINNAGMPGIATAAMNARSIFTQLRRVVGVCVVTACTLAAAVFVLTPRGIGSDVLGAFGKPAAAQIGFTDNARLGQSGFLNESQTPVLDVSLFDSEGRNIGDASRSVYLRGAVRDLYITRGQWVSTADPNSHGHDRATPEARLEISPSGADASLLFQRITPRATRRDGEDYYFHVWRPVWFLPTFETDLKRSPTDLSMRRASHGRSSGRGTYTVASALSDLNIHGFEPEIPTTFASGPIADLARSILADAAPLPETPAEAAAAGSGEDLALSLRRRRDATRIRDYLQQNYAYSLEMVAPREGQDPIEMFLFDTRRGHCEYFASAMVAMCQSARIPARLVLGYVATDFNPFTGQYTVRESNAHAWVEVSVGQGRWITLDPSPPAEIERLHKPPTGLLSRIRALYELIEFNWNESIVGFDSSRQRRMLGADPGSTGWLNNLARRMQDAWQRTMQFIGIPEDMRLGAEFLRVIIWWVGLATLITLFIWLIWRKRRSMVFRRLAHGEVDAELRGLLTQAGFYRRALRSLRRAGLEKPRARAPIDHAAVIARRSPDVAAALERIGRAYYALRFGRRRLSDAELAEAMAALDTIESSAARRVHTTAPAPTPTGATP